MRKFNHICNKKISNFHSKWTQAIGVNETPVKWEMSRKVYMINITILNPLTNMN